jgi:hypothetical protein
VKKPHRPLDSKTAQNMMTYAIVENLRTKDDENDGVDGTVDGIHAQGRKTWHLCLDFPADCRNPRLTGVCPVNLVFDVARVVDHRHYLVVGVAASDTLLELLVDSSLGRRKFDERDSG